MIAFLSEAAATVAPASMNALDFSWMSGAEGWIALLTLAVLEIVLGIDNIVFISILVDKLPESQRPRARFLGLALAMITRVLLLLSITMVMRLTTPWISVAGLDLTGKDLVLLVGGLFLIWKSTKEIHEKLEGDPDHLMHGTSQAGKAFVSILIQIALLDIIFSLDSVITAVGMAQHISIMVVAVLIAVGFMMLFAGAVSDFVNRHPTVKMLALSFLLMIGTALIADGLHFHVPKGYIYTAMGFSIMVEMLNLKMRKKRAVVDDVS